MFVRYLRINNVIDFTTFPSFSKVSLVISMSFAILGEFLSRDVTWSSGIDVLVEIEDLLRLQLCRILHLGYLFRKVGIEKHSVHS